MAWANSQTGSPDGSDTMRTTSDNVSAVCNSCCGGLDADRSQHERTVPMTFLWVYLQRMATIDHPSQPELPIAQRITCRRCKGVGTGLFRAESGRGHRRQADPLPG